MRVFFSFMLRLSLSLSLSLYCEGEGCEACLLTLYNTFNVLVRAANKT